MGRESSRAGFAPLAALLGGLFAAWLYGRRVIDPASADWLLHGDPAQHFLGSVFFLGEPWQWPPGAIERFGETPTSIVFTDSIPLLALLAKVLGVDASLQYFGIWMVACHALAAWFGLRLLQRLQVRRLAALAGAMFFVAAPALLLRAYGHEALMGHFLVLAALERALAPWRWGPWLLLAAASVLVHPYLAAMVGLLGAGSALSALLERKVGAGPLLAQAAASLALLGAVAWAAGYFVGAGEASAAGHGFFSANLLTWADPMDWAAFNRTHGREVAYAGEWSRLLPALPQATGGQYEGFAYMGAGALLAVGLAGLLSIARVRHPVAAPPPAESTIPAVRWACVFFAGGLLALLAVSARPSLGAAILAEVPLAPSAQHALGVFRASGRFIWPLTYLVLAWALARVGRVPRGAWLLLLCLGIQATDLSGKLREFRARFRAGPPGLEARVTAPLWQSALRRCPTLELVSAAPATGWVAPALAAGLVHARFLPAPTARRSAETEAARGAATQRLLAQRAWQKDRVYLLMEPLPGGMKIEEAVRDLQAGMRHERADGRDLIVPEACLRD